MSQIIFEELHLVPKYAKAHGIVMSLSFTVMMPLGVLAIRFLRVKETIWIHVVWQMLSWILMLSGLATGIRVGKILDRVSDLQKRALAKFFSFYEALTRSKPRENDLTPSTPSCTTMPTRSSAPSSLSSYYSSRSSG